MHWSIGADPFKFVGSENDRFSNWSYLPLQSSEGQPQSLSTLGERGLTDRPGHQVTYARVCTTTHWSEHVVRVEESFLMLLHCRVCLVSGWITARFVVVSVVFCISCFLPKSPKLTGGTPSPPPLPVYIYRMNLTLCFLLTISISVLTAYSRKEKKKQDHGLSIKRIRPRS